MPDIRQQIENILIKDLPWTITCPNCERDIDWDFDLDQVVDDLAEIINPRGGESIELRRTFTKTDEKIVKEVENGTVNMEGKY
jgi:hypothetical protein